MLQRRVAGVMFTVVMALAGLASADIPPPDGYVESCTVPNHQGEGMTCVECATYFGEPQRCQQEFGVQGYSHVCNTYGASAWSEVWCMSGAASGTGTGTGDGSGSQSEAPRGQTVGAIPAPFLAVGGALGLGLLLWSSRRRAAH